MEDGQRGGARCTGAFLDRPSAGENDQGVFIIIIIIVVVVIIIISSTIIIIIIIAFVVATDG